MMKNRYTGFLGSLCVAGVVTLIFAAGCSPRQADPESYLSQEVGDFIILYTTPEAGRPHIVFTHRDNPAKVVWETIPGELPVRARLTRTEFDRFQITFFVKEKVLARFNRGTLDSVELRGETLHFSGTLPQAERAGWFLNFSPSSLPTQLSFEAGISGILSEEELITMRICIPAPCCTTAPPGMNISTAWANSLPIWIRRAAGCPSL